MKLHRKIAIALVAIFASVATLSAEMRTSYFMEGSYFRTDMNAALAPTRGYIKVPVAGGIGIDFIDNYFSVNNLFYKRNGGVYTFMHNSVSADEFLAKLGNKGKMSANVNTSIVGFGAHTKKFFWSFGLNFRSNTEVTLSKDMFSALKNLSNGYHDLGDTHISNREYFEAALGFAIPVKDWMTFGFRAKGLVGLADISMQMDKMHLDINENQVKAELMGDIRANSPILRSKYKVGPLDEMEDGDIEQMLNTRPMDMLRGMRSWGLALDLGFEFRLLDDHLKLSIGANDIGFIRWYKGSTVNAQGNADLTFTGINLTTKEVNLDGDFAADLTPSQGSYTTRLSATLNAGAEYNILNNYIAFGVLSHTEFCQNFTRTELTASVNFRIGRWLTTSFSHTFLNGNEPGVLGWALNIHPPGFNLFVGADYIDTRFAVYNKRIPVPMMMKSANVYVGVGFNLGKAKYMPAMQERTRKAYVLKKKNSKS